MSKFTFICKNEERSTVVSCEAEVLDEVVQNFEEFLRGCGYYFNGQLALEYPDTTGPDETRHGIHIKYDTDYDGSNW